MVFFSGKPIFQYKLLGNVSDFDADVFGIYHWHVKVDIIMLMFKNQTPLHEMTVLSMSLMSSNDVVLVHTLPGYLKIKLPPTVILVQFLISLCLW